VDGFDLNPPCTEAAECGICRAAGGALTDVDGADVCEGCLRRIDASPHEKRQLMLTAGESLYW
jgi:hypothetical protein